MGQKHRVSEEKRIEITKACIERKLSLVDGARLAGVTKDVVREWVLRYQQQGEAGLKTTDENRSYSPELKEQAVREYLSGNGSQREIAAKYGLKSPKQLQTWIKVYNTPNAPVDSVAELTVTVMLDLLKNVSKFPYHVNIH